MTNAAPFTINHIPTHISLTFKGCNINASGFRAQADAMAGQGFRDAGYNLVLIQECISKNRSANGTIVVDPVKFPEGMPHLVGRDK
jgi:alpha-galactosidase